MIIAKDKHGYLETLITEEFREFEGVVQKINQYIKVKYDALDRHKRRKLMFDKVQLEFKVPVVFRSTQRYFLLEGYGVIEKNGYTSFNFTKFIMIHEDEFLEYWSEQEGGTKSILVGEDIIIKQ